MKLSGDSCETVDRTVMESSSGKNPQEFLILDW